MIAAAAMLMLAQTPSATAFEVEELRLFAAMIYAVSVSAICEATPVEPRTGPACFLIVG